jgi:DNA-directed RNA polymerase subunit beta'
VKNGQKLKKGDEICSWDPFNAVIISEVSGTVRFENVIEGITFREEADEQSGLKKK